MDILYKMYKMYILCKMDVLYKLTTGPPAAAGDVRLQRNSDRPFCRLSTQVTRGLPEPERLYVWQKWM